MDLKLNNQSAMSHIFILLLCIGLVHSNSNYKGDLVFRKERIYPEIGRLFRADIPLQNEELTKVDGDFKVREESTGHSTQEETVINDAIFEQKETPANVQQYSSVRTAVRGTGEEKGEGNYEESRKNDSSKKRLRRYKEIVLNGRKHETDYYENKNKKHDYDVGKKSIFRGNIKQRRTKRSEEYVKENKKKEENFKRNISNGTLQEQFDNNNKTLNIPKPVEDSTKVNRKDYAQKLFQRRVEALFNIDGDKDSGLSEEEIEKSKILRKQLLNIYVKSKQKNTLTLLHNRSVQEGNKETFTSKKGGKMMSPYVRMNIDVPLDDIEALLSEENENSADGSKPDIEGRGRRRRLLRILIPILLALKLKLAIVLPILFGMVTLIAFKGLWAGMTSLGVVSALALKSLIKGQNVFYDIRSPHHFHYPPVGHEVQYHHSFPEYWSRRDDSYKPIGGWSNIGLAQSKMDQGIITSDNDSHYADQDQKTSADLLTDKSSFDCNKPKEKGKAD